MIEVPVLSAGFGEGHNAAARAIVEAFDQPWKAKTEGGVGPYWGLWDAGRQANRRVEIVLSDEQGRVAPR